MKKDNLGDRNKSKKKKGNMNQKQWNRRNQKYHGYQGYKKRENAYETKPDSYEKIIKSKNTF